MSGAERSGSLQRVREYIERIKPLLRLSHWTIVVEPEPPLRDDVLATFNRTKHLRYASLRFADDHFGTDEHQQRNTITHELVHALLDDVDSAVQAMLDQLGPQGRALAEDRYVTELELAIDTLAHIISPHLPSTRDFVSDPESGGSGLTV